MSSILYPVYCILILMYWYTDVCTALYITVSLYINHIQSVYLSICTYPICLSVNLYLIFELYPNLYLIFEKLYICTSISTKSLPHSKAVPQSLRNLYLKYQIAHLAFLISNTCILYPVSCILYPDVLMYWCLYCCIYHCIAVYRWCTDVCKFYSFSLS